MGTPSIFTSPDGEAEYGNVTPQRQFRPWFKDALKLNVKLSQTLQLILFSPWPASTIEETKDGTDKKGCGWTVEEKAVEHIHHGVHHQNLEHWTQRRWNWHKIGKWRKSPDGLSGVWERHSTTAIPAVVQRRMKVLINLLTLGNVHFVADDICLGRLG